MISWLSVALDNSTQLNISQYGSIQLNTGGNGNLLVLSDTLPQFKLMFACASPKSMSF